MNIAVSLQSSATQPTPADAISAGRSSGERSDSRDSFARLLGDLGGKQPESAPSPGAGDTAGVPSNGNEGAAAISLDRLAQLLSGVADTPVGKTTDGPPLASDADKGTVAATDASAKVATDLNATASARPDPQSRLPALSAAKTFASAQPPVVSSQASIPAAGRASAPPSPAVPPTTEKAATPRNSTAARRPHAADDTTPGDARAAASAHAVGDAPSVVAAGTVTFTATESAIDPTIARHGPAGDGSLTVALPTQVASSRPNNARAASTTKGMTTPSASNAGLSPTSSMPISEPDAADGSEIASLSSVLSPKAASGAVSDPGQSSIVAGGILGAKAVVVSQETHLEIAANGAAMQIAVAVKAEIAPPAAQPELVTANSGEPQAAVGRTLVRTLSIVLTPEHLGTVSVDLRLAGGRLELSIAAAHPDTVQAIERDKAALSNALSATGVSVDAVVVRTTPSASGNGSLDTSGGSAQQGASQNNGSMGAGTGGSSGGTGSDGRHTAGSDRRFGNGSTQPDRTGATEAVGSGLFV